MFKFKGLYLVPRHAKLIHSKTKKLVVKKRFFRAIVMEDMALITKIKGQGLMLGFIRLKQPIRIDSDGFKRLRNRHLITNEEKNDWWPNAKRFFSYEIDNYYPLKKFKKVKIPIGIQTIQKKVGLSDLTMGRADLKDFIRDIKKYNPSKPSKKQLADDFRILCAWYSSFLKGRGPKGVKKKDLVELAKVIIREMKKRGFEFHKEKMKKTSIELFKLATGDKDFFLTIQPGPHSKRYKEKVKLDDFLKRWDSFKIFKDGIFVCGSLVNLGETDGDIDVVVKADPGSEMIELVEWRIQRAYPEWKDRIHVTPYGTWKGPFTNHVNLADIIAVKSSDLKVEEMSQNVTRIKYDGDVLPVIDQMNRMWG